MTLTAPLSYCPAPKLWWKKKKVYKPCMCYHIVHYFCFWAYNPDISLSLTRSTSFSFYIWLSHSLPLIKYSQLVSLNIHRAALLRLSALRQSASSECTRSPPKAWKLKCTHMRTHKHTVTHIVCLHRLRCGSFAERGGDDKEEGGRSGRRKKEHKKWKRNGCWGRDETHERKIRWRKEAKGKREKKKGLWESALQLLSMFTESRAALHLNNSTVRRVPPASHPPLFPWHHKALPNNSVKIH